MTRQEYSLIKLANTPGPKREVVASTPGDDAPEQSHNVTRANRAQLGDTTTLFMGHKELCDRFTHKECAYASTWHTQTSEAVS